MDSVNIQFVITERMVAILTGFAFTLITGLYLLVGGCVSGLLMRWVSDRPMSRWWWWEKGVAGLAAGLWPLTPLAVAAYLLLDAAWKSVKAPAAVGARWAYGNAAREEKSRDRRTYIELNAGSRREVTPGQLNWEAEERNNRDPGWRTEQRTDKV